MEKKRCSNGIRPFLYQNLKRMKLTLLLIMLTVFSSLAADLYSQNTKLSLEYQNEKIVTVLREIEDKSEYRFFYNEEVDVTSNVSIDVTNAPIQTVMDEVFRDKNVNYEIIGRQVILRAGVKMNQSQQPANVNGKVTDSSGQPLPGVTVVVKGTTAGTITDVDGNYSIANVPANGTLVFSFVGMRMQEIVVGNQSTVNVAMEEDAIGIEEVVAIGYGTVRKRDLTGSVQSVKSEDIVIAPKGNVMESIQGRVAGLNISRSSGRSGADMIMTLRGTRSINGSNTPLFIIDGVEGNYEDINPNDIESIEVLKDASSTAIYGSAGANGVIIITSKTGKKGELKINFDAYTGVNGLLQFPAVRTGDDYIELRRQANRTIGAWSPGDPDSKVFTNDEWNAIENDQWADWFDLGTRNGTLQNYSLSMSGGNDKTSAYFSLNYYNEEGILKDDDNTRYSFRGNVEHRISDWIKGGLNVLGAFTDRNERKGQYFTRVLSLMPLGTPYNEDGSINPFPLAGDTQLSPLADMAKNQYTNNYHILGVNPTTYLEINPVKGLSLRTVLSSYLNFSRHGLYKGALSADGYGDGKSSAQVINGNIYNYKWENILSYKYDLSDDHHFIFTGVTSWSKNQNENSSILGYNIDWDKYLFHNLAATDGTSRVATSNYTRTQLMSYVARLNYNYKDRYLFTVSNRWDGSSILAEGKKWDNFPAAAIAWRISDEPFMTDASSIDNLKLRVGYGITGNAGADAYSTLSFGAAGSNLAFQETPAPYYMFSRNIANKNLGWEKSYNWNAGVDLNMFKNRLNITLDAYRTNTKDILFNRNLPASTGGYQTSNYSIWENVCETLNQGVEAVINSNNLKDRELTWSTTLTFARNHEEITEFTSDAPVTNGQLYLVKGHPINSHYDYKYLGIWQENEAEEAAVFGRVPGDVKILDYNEDSQYTTDDRVVLGSPTPKWTAGLSNTFTYKGFDLTIFLDSRWGGMMNYMIMGWYNPDGTGNGPALADYWTPENPGGHFPRPNASYGRFANMPLGTTSLFYIDGSYIKLRNLTIGYSLPKSLLKKLDLTKARVYATASNLFTYTKSDYLKDYDPELGGADEFPLARQVVIGVNISF